MSIRAWTLRKQVALMGEIVERAADMSSDDAARWAYALIPLTDDLLRELTHHESGTPYTRNRNTDPPGGADLFWTSVHTDLSEIWGEIS